MYDRPVKNFLLVLGAAFFLCYFAFENRYPLTTSDTGTYVQSGFTRDVPDDRPILYGLFIRHISLAESLYFVILAQGLLLAYVLFLYFKYFAHVKNKPVWYALLVMLLIFFTGASVNVSQLIPDIFTPLMILCLGLLVSSFLNTTEKKIAAAIFVFSISTHLSHALMCFMILAILSVAAWLSKEVLIKRRTLVKAWALTVASAFVIPTVHYIYDGHFRANNATHVFMLCKLKEMGILDHYLEKNCDKHDLKICAYKGQIPLNFIWDFDNSPVYKTGGWEANKAEYNFIIRDALTTPRYLKKFVEKAFSHSLSQLFTFSTGDTPRADEGSAPYGVINWFFHDDMPQFTTSLQNQGQLDFTFLNNRQLLLLAFCSFLLFALCSLNFNGIPIALKQTGIIILTGIVANAIVCGTLSTIWPRYQSRVVWLLPILAFLLALSQWEFIRARLKGLMIED